MKSDLNLWDCYNGLIISEDVSRLRKILVRAHLFQKITSIPGAIIEAGVFKGAGWFFWLKMIDIYLRDQGRWVYGFDTFEGFSTKLLDYEKLSAKSFVNEAAFLGASPEQLEELANASGFQNGKLIKGEVRNTIPDFCHKNKGLRIALVNLDFDTYEGTKIALNYFGEMISPGGIIILDEYGKPGWGESQAVDEFLSETPWQMKSVPFSDQPSAYLIKSF